VDRHGLSALAMTRVGKGRDDKGGVSTMKGVKRLELLFCHCEEDDRTTGQSIVSRETRKGDDARFFTYSGSTKTSIKQ